MDKLTQEELAALYVAYVMYRDNECDGYASMSVLEFYRRTFA